MLRRLHHEQPDSFAFTAANLTWAEGQISKYPEGRQASAIIPLLWRAQEQEGWLSRPAIEGIADMLGLAHIRALEVATFYFMFQLQPVGKVAHIQVCGTTSCLICGAEDLIGVCREKIAEKPHVISADGKLSWEEVECLGACTNAPMAQIGKDYYENLTAEKFATILDELAAGRVPVPGPQNGRYAAEPLGGLTSLTEYDSGRTQYNASVQLATDLGDTVKRIDGSEVPLLTPWRREADTAPEPAEPEPSPEPKSTPEVAPDATPASGAKPVAEPVAEPVDPAKPEMLEAPRDGGADDLKMIKGVGPKLEKLLNQLGVYHFDQIAGWSAGDVAWVDENLTGFKGRVSRDDWVTQARALATGIETEFSKRAKKDGIYDS